MAKATEADLDAALKITQIITDLEKRCMPSSEEGEFAGHFDRNDPEQCMTALHAILNAAYKGNLFRVTFGMVVVIDPRNELVDPDADTLEVHPKVKAALEAGEWQPIDTAPKDGTEVLLMVERRAGMTGCSLVGHYMQGGHCIEDHPPISAGWYFWNGCMFDTAAKPTHWLPLPSAPEKDNG
jgi:hypothetical protein